MSGTINAIVGVVVGLIVIAFMLGIGMFLYYTSYTSILYKLLTREKD